jgi:hypothetical protein
MAEVEYAAGQPACSLRASNLGSSPGAGLVSEIARQHPSNRRRRITMNRRTVLGGTIAAATVPAAAFAAPADGDTQMVVGVAPIPPREDIFVVSCPMSLTVKQRDELKANARAALGPTAKVIVVTDGVTLTRI